MAHDPKSLITFNAYGGIKFDKEAGVFVTWAPSLQVLSQGTSKTEAKRALTDAVGLLLTTAYDMDILETLLKGAGLRPAPPSASIAELQEYVTIQEDILEKEDFDPFELPVPIRLTSPAITAERISARTRANFTGRVQGNLRESRV